MSERKFANSFTAMLYALVGSQCKAMDKALSIHNQRLYLPVMRQHTIIINAYPVLINNDADALSFILCSIWQVSSLAFGLSPDGLVHCHFDLYFLLSKSQNLLTANLKGKNVMPSDRIVLPSYKKVGEHTKSAPSEPKVKLV